MKDFGKITYGHAAGILKQVFGAEFIGLDEHSAKLVAQDYLEAVYEDGLGAREYQRRIGAGNLRSYADVMIVRERKGWDK